MCVALVVKLVNFSEFTATFSNIIKMLNNI